MPHFAALEKSDGYMNRPVGFDKITAQEFVPAEKWTNGQRGCTPVKIVKPRVKCKVSDVALLKLLNREQVCDSFSGFDFQWFGDAAAFSISGDANLEEFTEAFPLPVLVL